MRKPNHRKRTTKFNTLYDPQRFVDKLANYYATIAKCSTTTEECQSNDSSPDVNNQAVSIGEVKQYLRRINSSKSVNSEDYPPWVTKLRYEDLCVPITDIVNQSLQEAKYPMLYKQAEITPVPEHNSPASPKDYRPISLLWHIGKVAENFINKQLRAFLLPKLHSNQFAYMDGVGCTDALVSLLDDATKLLDNDDNFGSQLILYDFSKAFDMMHHSLLSSKLRRFEIPKPMTKLISDYLLGCVQCVHLKQHKTRSATTKFDVGVPGYTPRTNLVVSVCGLPTISAWDQYQIR